MRVLNLPQRTEKPRSYGITSVYDKGISIGELRHILTDYHAFIDIAKLGIGTAYITPRLEEKIALYREFGVIVHFGGTLFEKFYHQLSVSDYKAYLKSVGVDWIEVSTGTLNIPLAERIAIVKELSQEFVIVAEVGSKDRDQLMPPAQWVKEIKALLAAGSRYVVTEGRGSGTVGLYNPNGKIKNELMSEIMNAIDPKELIFEAPKPEMQTSLINLVGANVNLGNVSPYDLLLIETQRYGLRNETFFLKDNVSDGEKNALS